MSERKRILFLGGDRRELRVMRSLLEAGQLVEAWGWEAAALPRGAQTAPDAGAALAEADAAILPVPPLNEDGKLDKADVKEMIRRLTGAPEKDPEETDVTTTATDATVPPRPETTTDPYLDIPMPLYGPPTAY